MIYGVTRAGLVRHIMDGGPMKAKCGIPLRYRLEVGAIALDLVVCRTCLEMVEPRAKGLPFMLSKNPRLYQQKCPQCRRSAKAHLVGGMAASARVMKGHPRCGRCDVLLGVGHLDRGNNGWCGTCSR